jgi:hypothetical protein
MRRALILPSSGSVRAKILILRGQRVLLDRDLAELYGVGTKVLNQAVRRNANRFPADFMFQLSAQELAILRSQIVTSSWGGVRRPPMAFTEHGVAMLSSVLRSARAVEVSIGIMRAFVELRGLASAHTNLTRRLDSLEKKYDGQFRVVFEALRQVMTPPVVKRRKIGFRA